MPEPKKFTLDPNFDPRGNNLPDIPAEIVDYKNSQRFRRMMVIIGCGILALLLIGLLIGWYFKTIGNEYRYIKLMSLYVPSPMDESPGADLESIVVTDNGNSYYAQKVVSTSDDFNKQPYNKNKDSYKMIGAPGNDADYVSLGEKGNYIVIKTKVNLKDKNIDTLTINEITPDNLKEPYDVFMGTSKNGPWDYLGQQAGAVDIDLTQFLK
ncbi:MAG: hypothetical protein WC752_02650 [Patescibacteria group bacterium]|jgi:hypothetical protein